MWEWKWNPEREIQLAVLKNCISLEVQLRHADFILFGQEDHATYWKKKKKTSRNLRKWTKLFLVCSKTLTLVYNTLLFYFFCFLVCAIHFPHWTPSAIPWEEHYYPHLQMRKRFRIYIDTLHQIAPCIAPEMRTEHEAMSMWLKHVCFFHLITLMYAPKTFSLPP